MPSSKKIRIELFKKFCIIELVLKLGVSMKIITENKVYVQKNDLAFLYGSRMAIPGSIFSKVFMWKMIVNDENRYEFVCFDDPSEIDYFKKIPWMIDFQSVASLSEKQMIMMMEKVNDERKEVSRKYQNLPSEQQNRYLHLIYEKEELEFKMHSLNDIILFRKKELSMPFPEEMDPCYFIPVKKSFFWKSKTKEEKQPQNCMTCTNMSCQVEYMDKIGMDEQGRPNGTNCLGWENHKSRKYIRALEQKSMVEKE